MAAAEATIAAVIAAKQAAAITDAKGFHSAGLDVGLKAVKNVTTK